MFINSLKLTLRQFNRRKSYVLINLIGLTLGLTTAMLIGKYVMNEWYTDAFVPNAERTFRLVRVGEINLEPYDVGVTSAPYAPALESDYSDDIESTTRVLKGSSIVQIDNERFEETNYLYVDPNFISFFNLPLLYGDPKEALGEANRIVLTRQTAEKYFESAAAALGKILRIDNNYDAIVTGVFDDLPFQSHLEFDLVESNQSLYNLGFWTRWWNNSLVTYLRLNEAVSAENFNSRLPDFMDKYFGDDFARTGNKIGLKIQPLKDIYFASDTRYDPVKHGNRSGVMIFFFAAILLVVIACINYINLTTATAITRSKEMAIHKVLGSGKSVIIKRMLMESLLLTTLAILFALQLAYIALPWFSNLLGTTLNFEFPIWKLSLIIIALGLFVSFVSGFYPGLIMASFQPKKVLKGSAFSRNNSTGLFRKGLVIFQYALSTVLLCSTFLIYQQLNFLGSKELGFDKDQVLIIRSNNREIVRQSMTFKNELLRKPGIQSVSFMNGEPGGFHDATTIDLPSLSKDLRMRTAFVDFDYVTTLGLELIAGRGIQSNLASDSTESVLINEQALKDIGLAAEDILGQTLYMTAFDTLPKKVIGVVKNYHFSSLHDEIEPLVISYSPRTSMIAVKIQGDNITESIASVENVWTKMVPAFPFNYSFLDERLQRHYNDEIKQGQLFGFFAVIAIFIACLGIFGLAIFSASNRVKEIGIRKVLGASVLGIVVLLSKDVIKLVAISIIFASPIAYFFMDNWLDEFAYRINIHWGVFIIAGLIAVMVAFITVSFQSIKTALIHPANSLRSD